MYVMIYLSIKYFYTKLPQVTKSLVLKSEGFEFPYGKRVIVLLYNNEHAQHFELNDKVFTKDNTNMFLF